MNKNIRYIKDLLWFFVFWGVVAAVLRLWFGLGATTNLTDDMPWGLWKILNMVAGVALSTCGFTVGFLAYVLKIERFKPLVRPAILVAFLGYGSSCMALFFDIGLPYSFWHPFFYWNIHSFLFEVFWCVILYFTVTVIELTPNILERYKLEKTVKFLHKIAPVVVMVGITLSSLHHSSLGSLFLTTPFRLHDLWYSGWLPVMFIVSAMGGGMFFIILVKMIYSRLYNPISVFGREFKKEERIVCATDGSAKHNRPKTKGKEFDVLEKLSIIAASIMGIYLIIKIYDLLAYGSINSLMAGTWESWLFAIEITLTAIIPITVIAIPKARKSVYGLGFAAFSASFGVVMNRMDVGIFGYFQSSGVVYFPSLAEWAVSIGVVSAAALALMYISENFTIFDELWKKQKVEKGLFSSAFDSFSRVWLNVLHNGVYRISVIGVFIVPIAFVAMYPPFASSDDVTVQPAKGMDVERTVLLIDGNSDKEFTEFKHFDHQNRLGGKQSCIKCHHINMPDDPSTPCARCHTKMLTETMIFDHSYHTVEVAKDNGLKGLHPENKSCNVCHPRNQARTRDNAAGCTECHADDMNLKNDEGKDFDFLYADSYMDAMHNNCIPCHEKEEKKPMFADVGKKLSDCSTCHDPNGRKVVFSSRNKYFKYNLSKGN
jgi:Ni/Fe-hydrogenase subunit HybB-like protein